MIRGNATLAAMEKAGVPLTRSNYIQWATLGEYDEDTLDPELEAELLPAQFRREALDGAFSEAPMLTTRTQ